MGIKIDAEYTTRMEYDGTKVLYVGEAQPGTATSSPNWRIKKLTYSGNLVTQIDWAGGSNAFDKIWDSRTSYTYS